MSIFLNKYNFVLSDNTLVHLSLSVQGMVVRNASIVNADESCVAGGLGSRLSACLLWEEVLLPVFLTWPSFCSVAELSLMLLLHQPRRGRADTSRWVLLGFTS